MFLPPLSCPRCHKGDVWRSGRKTWLEYLISPLILPYRCQYCDTRFYGLRRGIWRESDYRPEP